MTTHKIHGIYYSSGNRKVKFPIVNLGSATNCPSQGWCGFSSKNYKSSGRKLCYAQKIERVRPSVLKARNENQRIIESLRGQQLQDVASDLADGLFNLVRRKRKENRIVRINESGDLSKHNIEFACRLVTELNDRGIKTYLYSKAPAIYGRLISDAGATVLHSEYDFVAVPDEASGVATGLNKCPGTCGPCKACPSGIKSWIVEH